MAADFHFFTETTLLRPQRRREAFGPARAIAGPDRYRTSSMHRATSHPAAYAVCRGQVCVQKVPSTTLVNLVLRPLEQPDLNFSPVKYIIYKGIQEASLINGAEVAEATTNDLTGIAWAVQASKNASAGTSANAPAEALGVGLTAAASADFGDGKPIDNLFYRTSGAFEFPIVSGGATIGLFDKDAFGIEILLEGLGYYHPVSLARTLGTPLSVPALGGSPTPAQRFEHWHAKEQVLGFMDPCAFYGSFFRTGIRVRSSASASFEPKPGDKIYQDVLSSFVNRNTAYLDIRNEHNFSLNYFRNYGDTIQLSYDPANDAPAPVDYYGSGWPLLALKGTSFPANNTTREHNAFRIQLPEGDNPIPLLYVSQGYRAAPGDAFPDELDCARRFFDAFQVPVGGYTRTGNADADSMTFVVPNVKGQSGTAPVSCYLRLKYLRQQPATITPSTVPTVIQSQNYLDNLIYPLDLRVLLAGPSSIKSAVYAEEVYVDARGVAGLDCDFIGSMGIAHDLDNTSFFVVPTCIRTPAGPRSTLVSLSGEASDYRGHYPNFIALKYALQRVSRSDLDLSTGDVPVAKFTSDADAAAVARFSIPDFSKLILLVIANATYGEWKTAMTLIGVPIDPRFRTYLAVKNLQQNLIDDAGVQYTSFELKLRGLGLDAVTNSYQVQEVGWTWTHAKVYAHAGP